MRLLLALALSAVVVHRPPLAAAAADGGPRLRPQDARLTQLLRQGAARSTTFKALVDRIEASNVIVYMAAQSADEVEPVRHADLDDAGRRLPLRARLDQPRPDAAIR